MPTFYVDQSGKWESSQNTAIGVSNDCQHGILIDSTAKRQIGILLNRFKQERNRSKKTMIIRLFACSVYLSIRDFVRSEDVIVIDKEYDGQENSIRDFILALFRRFSPGLEPRISFDYVGKLSRAHAVAHQVFVGSRRPEKRLAEVDFIRLFDRTENVRAKALRRRISKRMRE